MAETFHVLGGIDEAGLGPLLGPLVVAGLVLAGKQGESPWDALADAFCKKRASRRDRRIRVDDSKLVKTGKHGHRELERTALALLHATTGSIPKNVAELLALGVGTRNLTHYPWYKNAAEIPLPRYQDRASLELDVHVGARAFAKAGVSCLAYPFRVVDVSTFNSLIRKHDNKGIMLFDATVPVMKACVLAAHEARSTQWTDATTTLVIDRHGGRSHYRGLLQRAFPSTRIEIVEETTRVSRYHLGEHTEILFAENGESRAFPTAAGSCLAKYVREVLVERINDWFLARRPGLKRTAGYYTDGRRFLADVADLAAELPRDLLVRIR